MSKPNTKESGDANSESILHNPHLVWASDAPIILLVRASWGFDEQSTPPSKLTPLNQSLTIISRRGFYPFVSTFLFRETSSCCSSLSILSLNLFLRLRGRFRRYNDKRVFTTSSHDIPASTLKATQRLEPQHFMKILISYQARP